MSELFEAVDALLESQAPLPPPAERERLRKAHGLTQDQVAKALQVRRPTVVSWENGRTEPRSPQREAYARLLARLTELYPPQPEPPAPRVAATAVAAEAVAPAAPPNPAPPQRPAPAGPAPEPAAPSRTAVSRTAVPPPAAPPAHPTGPAPRTAPAAPARSTDRRPATPRPAPTRAAAPAPAADPRFPHGPLLVLDGDGCGYGTGGIVLDCPATRVPDVAAWTLAEAGVGAARLHRAGRDADPLVVLTAAGAARLGLPDALADRRGLRLPDDHPVVKEVARAGWRLTQRGFGPWARVYRPVAGGRRACVQFAVLPWDALDARTWGGTAELPAPEVARILGEYATRVLTPRGSAATCGLELMTALRPPTRAVRDDDGTWVSAPNPGALTAAVDPAPPEAPVEHPVAQGWDGGFLDEEAYQWVREVGTLADEECLLPWAVGIDINTAFLAAASRLTVGLGEPVHVERPRFDKKTPGAWRVDLSHVEVDPRLPSPFTPSGRRPEGPAWYATPTVAYAVELGHEVRASEAFVRPHAGPYLDPWHDRLKAAYLAMLAELGVPVGKDADERAYLAAMAGLVHADPGSAAVLAAVKSTVKGGIGKLRERPQGRRYRDGERWPALERPTWRPDIRAAVIAQARVNMHRKMLKVARTAGRYPLAVLSDCVVYPSAEPTPFGFLPQGEDGRVLTGTFRLGPSPGMAKLEGVQTMVWAVELMEQGLNPARHVKGGDAVVDEGE